MTTNVPKVSSHTTVLEAVVIMNKNGSSGVVVFDGENVVGILTDRRLLTSFFQLNRKPEEVKVSEVMGPLYRIEPDATTKEAAKKIVDHRITRLGVFNDDKKFLGWISLADLARHFSSKRNLLLDRLRSHNEPETSEFLCPNCRSAFMDKITDHDGHVLRWQCPKCDYTL